MADVCLNEMFKFVFPYVTIVLIRNSSACYKDKKKAVLPSEKFKNKRTI
jgi:hypothetical protein